MKIAYDYKIFWNQRYGGISRYFVNLFYQLNKHQIDYVVFAPFYKNKFLREFPYKNIQGRYFDDKMPFTSNLFQFLNEKICSRELKKSSSDLIHYTYYSKNIQKNVKTIITVYDLIHEKMSLEKGKIILPKKKMIESADHIICISETTKNDLINFYKVDEKKLSVTYLGANHYNLNNSNISKDIDFPFLLYVGSRLKYKNFDFFVKAYAKSSKINKNFKIVLFGGGKLNKKEKELLGELKIDESKVIQFEGNDNLLNLLYQKASAFIFPSIYEGFGLPIVESLKNKCPVICSRISIFEEIGKNNVNYFDLEDIDNLIDTILKVVEQGKKEKIFHNNIDLILENFNWENCFEKTIKIYKNIIN